MQMCFILSGRPSTKKSKNGGDLKDEDDETQSHSGAVQRLLYKNASCLLGILEESEAERYKEKFESDYSLQMSSNLLEELPESPSFKIYLRNDSRVDLRRESHLGEKQAGSSVREQKEGVRNKLRALMGTSVPLPPDKEPLKKGNKKKKRCKLLKKNRKGSKNSHPQSLLIPPKYLREYTAAVMLQKITRGFLLRKHLRILHNIKATAEEFGRQVAKYEANLERNRMANFLIEDELIMHLLSEINLVRVPMVYKIKVIEKITSLQKTVNSVADKARMIDLGALLKKSGFVADCDKTSTKRLSLSNMQRIEMDEKGNSIEEIESTGDKKYVEDIDWDSSEDESDIVMDFWVPNAPKIGTIEMNLAEEPEDELYPIEMQKTSDQNANSDPVEVEKGSDLVVELEKLMKPPLNDDDHNNDNEISLTENNNAEKSLKYEDVETSNKVFDPIKYKTFAKSRRTLRSSSGIVSTNGGLQSN